MSWVVSGHGRAKALALKLATDFANINCDEPEQTIKNQIANVVTVALTAMPENTVVDVAASGLSDADWKRPAAERSARPATTVHVSIAVTF